MERFRFDQQRAVVLREYEETTARVRSWLMELEAHTARTHSAPRSLARDGEPCAIHVGVERPADSRGDPARRALPGRETPVAVLSWTAESGFFAAMQLRRSLTADRVDTEPSPRELCLGSSQLHERSCVRSVTSCAPAPGHAQPAGPEPPRESGRLPWATLLRRVFAIEVLVCPRCTGPRRS